MTCSKPLYVVNSIFNPMRFKSRIKLYNYFAKWIAQFNVSLITVEVAFEGRDFEVTESGNPLHVQLRSNQFMWHKERCLNIALERLGQIDSSWEFVSWMDADIKIARDDWVEAAIHILQHTSIIQLYGEVRDLYPDHHRHFDCKSSMRNFQDFGPLTWGPTAAPTGKDHRIECHQGHPGLAWAFRRDCMDYLGGFLDVCANGSGDMHMAGCFTGNPDLGLQHDMDEEYKRAIYRYAGRCQSLQLSSKLGYLPGCADHYWHGKSMERGYEIRQRILADYKYNPYEDIIRDTQGLYRWAGNKPWLEAAVKKSLSSRNEDSTDK